MDKTDKPEDEKVGARREFLARCGKFAVVTPPTVGLLLSAANRNYAVASSGNGNNQGGNNNNQGGNNNR